MSKSAALPQTVALEGTNGVSTSTLLLLIPLGFMPKYFADVALFRGDAGLGEREAAKSHHS